MYLEAREEGLGDSLYILSGTNGPLFHSLEILLSDEGPVVFPHVSNLSLMLVDLVLHLPV